MSAPEPKPTPEQIKATLKKFNITVESLKECAKSDVHVCSDRRVLDSDGEGKCCECGRPVFFHDKFPEDGPQPKKICMDCLPAFVAGEKSFGA